MSCALLLALILQRCARVGFIQKVAAIAIAPYPLSPQQKTKVPVVLVATNAKMKQNKEQKRKKTKTASFSRPLVRDRPTKPFDDATYRQHTIRKKKRTNKKQRRTLGMYYYINTNANTVNVRRPLHKETIHTNKDSTQRTADTDGYFSIVLKSGPRFNGGKCPRLKNGRELHRPPALPAPTRPTRSEHKSKDSPLGGTTIVVLYNRPLLPLIQ